MEQQNNLRIVADDATFGADTTWRRQALEGG
jgi:hypothetical protein